MGELRKDYILDRYVIIATERGKRPHQFIKDPIKTDTKSVDFFAQGNEHLTPDEIYRWPEKSKNWKIRVNDNERY